jgi:hypothetical protein
MGGKNGGMHILPELVCKAIPDPSIDMTSDAWKKKPRSGDQPRKQPPPGEAPPKDGEEEPPQKNAG